MILKMEKCSAPTDIANSSWDVGIVGPVLDERGRNAVEFIQAKASKLIELAYESEALVVTLNGDRLDADDLPSAIISEVCQSTIVIEASTLGFVPILLLCNAFRKQSISEFDFVYVEPEGYKNIPQAMKLLDKRKFVLSSAIPGYSAIPGNVMVLSKRGVKHKGVFFLGYEESRLRRAFEEVAVIQPQLTSVVFGVPAFRPGWEMDSFANNVTVMREKYIQGSVSFCGADNPLAAFELLEQVRLSLQSNERMFVAPIGTKPHGIGAALFASRNEQIGVVYDHPIRKKDRSDQVAFWHLFRVSDFR